MTTLASPVDLHDDPTKIHEKIPTQIYPQGTDANKAVAAEIAQLIRDKAAAGEKAVLGLATGSTPTGVYAELVRMHQQECLSFANVITFNLDEYFPMQPNELQSYVRFMNEHLFDHIDIDKNNVNVPDGTLKQEEVAAYCKGYEQAIVEAGGIDIQILGIGRTGHVGFNEPGSGKESRTRLIWLDQLTRLDAASDFFGLEYVPSRAITMGVGTILDARRIIMMAFGEGKAPIVAKAIEGPVTSTVAASYLQDHPNSTVILDEAASAKLTRIETPWLTGTVDWGDQLIRRAVIWLAQRIDKPILKLTDLDYNENGLQELIAEHGPAYNINIRVFRSLQKTITGWPGGRPKDQSNPGPIHRDVDDTFPKRVVIFSPHPDDDVISMGGTLIRLVDHGHEVHVAYQVSGSIAVFDEDAMRFADFATDFNRFMGIEETQTKQIESHIEEFLRNKKPGQVDSDAVQKLKALIRRGEARAAGRYCGIPYERLHFLDMPFYETGTVRKSPLGEEDVNIIENLLSEVKPHQIYAAGDLSDPHGTHRVCLSAIMQAVERLQASADWYKDNNTALWLYRGAWQEWEPEKIEMAVPLSPDELMRKRIAIFKHESQKDKALFPGTDEREFWKRAEDRNQATAQLYDALGLAEYEAIEAFVKWRG